MIAGAPDRVRQAFAEAATVQQALLGLTDAVVQAGTLCWDAFKRGQPVLVFGNGGSAAEAQHFAAELSGRFLQERRPLPALALTTDTSVLTAVGNDYGYEFVFARQVRAFGKPGGVVLGISTSGRSRNVVEGFRVARELGLGVVAVTGPTPAEMGELADVVLAVPGSSTARIQEGHLSVLHVLCDLIEASLVEEGLA